MIKKCITFPEGFNSIQKIHLLCAVAFCSFGMINISGTTPEAGLLKMMCYHLAQWVDSMVPEKKITSLSKNSS